VSTLRFAFLGSGSRGNALLLEAGQCRVLVDCGFSTREIVRRLEQLHLGPQDLNGVLLTHEHGDHASGIGSLSRKYQLPVYATAGTRMAVNDENRVDWREISAHGAFELSGLQVQPVAVPHDAREPVQFLFTHQGKRLGLLTDLGHITPHVLRSYADCHGLVLEANHDRRMLAAGPYPASLKERVGGPFGHLSNEQSAAFLDAADTGALEWLVAAHISEKNNDWSLARTVLADALGWPGERIKQAHQDQPSDWYPL